jgi:hypothetical protein
MNADAWLKCVITTGQFTGEYAVQAQAFNGEGFSLFAAEEDLSCRDFPAAGQQANASLRVRVIEEQGDLRLIALPQQTLENGQLLTVKADQLTTEPMRTRQSV